MEFDPIREGEEAGLTARMNERHHCEIGVIRADGPRQIIVRQRVGDLERIDRHHVPPTGALELRVSSDGRQYRFAWARPGEPDTDVGVAEARYLSSEVAGGFTGVFLGMYATGNGRRSSTDASWDWFEYQASDSAH
jgi:alpha-N-arabinofuranosidase